MKRKPKSKPTQAAAAQILRVTKWHLNRVLNGKRESRRLTLRYRALMASYN